MAPTPIIPAAVASPEIIVIPVGFYLDNAGGNFVPFSSSASCGGNPLDLQSGTLGPNESLWDGGFFSGCLVGAGSGNGTVTIYVGEDSNQCSFAIQVVNIPTFTASGGACAIMQLPNVERKQGSFYYHLIYSQAPKYSTGKH